MNIFKDVTVTSNYFPGVKTWSIPESALLDSLNEMARDGIAGREGITLWLGRRIKGLAEVTHLVALRGPGVIKRPDFLRIKPWLVNEVSDVAIELGIALVGQIHSHGPGYGTDLSIVDRHFGITVPYYLSLVAPDYATRPSMRLGDCGVHVFEPSFGYRRLAPAEAEERIHLVRGVRLPFTVVGAEE